MTNAFDKEMLAYKKQYVCLWSDQLQDFFDEYLIIKENCIKVCSVILIIITCTFW